MGKYIQSTLISVAELKEMTTRLGQQITADYQDKELVMVGILRGSVVFMTDLMRAINLPMVIDFMSVSSYQGTKSSGVVRIIKDIDVDITDKHVLLVEDIVDTGLTLDYLRKIIMERKPASLAVCTAFDKRAARKIEVPVEYVGLQVPNAFVVGYGLDYQQHYRNLPDLEILADDGVDDE